MESSFITKKRIAKALKELMKQKKLEQISITEIMKQAKIRRQTFYNYFEDKYALLEWIFETELKEQVADNLEYVSSKHLLEHLFLFFHENQLFYQKLFELDGQNSFKDYFSEYCLQIIDKYLNDHQKMSELLTAEEKAFFKSYHACALSEFIHQTLKFETITQPNNCQTIDNMLFASLASFQNK